MAAPPTAPARDLGISGMPAVFRGPGSGGPGPSWTPDYDLPLDWAFRGGSGGGGGNTPMGIDHFPGATQHDIDQLVDTDDAGYDVGTISTDLDLCPADVQAAFDNWTELTSVPGVGTPYGCGGGFPCAPWRTITTVLPRGRNTPAPGEKDPQWVDPCTITNDPCPPGPFKTFIAGAAQLQWVWICARLVPNPGVDEDLRALFNISVDDVESSFINFNATVACIENNSWYGAVAAVRCRQIFANRPLRISLQRLDVRNVDASATDALDDASLTVTLMGRLGHVVQ